MATIDPYYGKHHVMFDKDVYRVMKNNKEVNKSKLVKKPSGVKHLIDYNNCKYKTRSHLLLEQYQSPAITEDKLYLIDKVVRMRCKDGRFGVDHSEILNFELEQANRTRDEHMNSLVYKAENPHPSIFSEFEKQIVNQGQRAKSRGGLNYSTSQILFKRLASKGPVSSGSRCSLLDSGRNKRGGSARSIATNRNAPNFQQWVRRKDAEKRLRKKLLDESKNEIRSGLLEYAKNEKVLHDSRVNHMDEWLIKKKLNEAYKITQLRDVQKQDVIDQESRQYGNVKNYKMWLKQKSMQERYSEMEMARMAQIQAEQMQKEEAQMNVQREINELNHHEMYNQNQQQMEMDDY